MATAIKITTREPTWSHLLDQKDASRLSLVRKSDDVLSGAPSLWLLVGESTADFSEGPLRGDLASATSTTLRLVVGSGESFSRDESPHRGRLVRKQKVAILRPAQGCSKGP